MKEITDPQWKNDKGFLDWVAWMKKYYPEGALDDQSNAFAYNVAILMTQVLKQCGNDLSRENIMKQAANVKNFELPLLLPGIKVNHGSERLRAHRAEQLAKFNARSGRRSASSSTPARSSGRRKKQNGRRDDPPAVFLFRVDRYWPAGGAEERAGCGASWSIRSRESPGTRGTTGEGAEYGSTSVPSYPPPGCVQHICGTPSIIPQGVPSGTGPRLFPDS